jgi:Na+/melibiose symporter-like transporter
MGKTIMETNKTAVNASVKIKTTPLGFKTCYGTATMGAVESISVALMTSWFMLYLTDYAGAGTWATSLGAVVLFIARAFDAVNDPIEGWIMDRARVGKHGKYKPFIILSIFLMAIGTVCLFFIPTGVTNNPIIISVWVVFFYLMYDVGGTFFAPNLIYRTLTLDSTQRGKLMIAPRMMNIVIGAIGATLISIVNAVNANIGNLHTAFGVTIVIIVAVMTVVALIGIALIREKYHSKVDEKAERVKLRDVFLLIKENKALRIKLSTQVFTGFIWTFSFTTGAYYMKWAYCADLTTGAVDTELFGMFSMIGAAISLVPIIVGTVIATPLMEAFGSGIKLIRLMILIETLLAASYFCFK